MIKVSGNIWQSIPWKLRSALRSMLSVFKGRILYQRILGLLYFNLSFDENGRKTREIINRNCALVLRTREQNSDDPPEVTLHGWSPEMSAQLLATLMDCPEGCKDAWDCYRLSNIECYVRCGQSVDRAWIFLSVTTRCMWQLGGPVHYKIHDKECLLQRTPLLCFGHSILVHCRYIVELRSAVCTPAPDTAPIFKTKLQNFKLLSSQSRCTASMPSDAEKDSNWATSSGVRASN